MTDSSNEHNLSEHNPMTFLIVREGTGDVKRVTISARRLKFMLSMSLILFVVLATCVVDYVGLLSQNLEVQRLRAENLQLKNQFQIVEGKLNALESGLERVKSWVVKLKNITDIEDDSRELKLAIGPLPRVGDSMLPAGASSAGSGALRDPASLGLGAEDGVGSAAVEASKSSLKTDALFSQRTPVNDDAGELTVEGQRDYASLALRIDQAVGETFLREQGVLDLYNHLSERRSLLLATPNIRPAKGWLTSKFGYRISPFTSRPVMHNGLDIAAAPGSPVFAPADGVVSFAGYDSSYGKLVSIDHGYGVVTRYGHLSSFTVHKGQKIRRRDLLASVGNTGRSTGPHLHYEVRVNNIPVDPLNYILDE